MVENLVKIITNSSEAHLINDSTLICKYIIEDITVIQNLEDGGAFENTFIDDPKVGDEIELEISLPKVMKHGYYHLKHTFLIWHKYHVPKKDIYIHEIKGYKDTLFFNVHRKIIDLKDELVRNAKHTYNENQNLNLILLLEDKSLFLPIIYNTEDVDSITQEDLKKFSLFIKVLRNNGFTDKKNIFINTIIEELTARNETERFSILIKSLSEIYEKALASYDFYLRNFSYNKLKLELDSKATEFNQKLQSVINDSQNKLIAIPTALVFVLATIDYENINSIKNYMIVIGLVIFSVLIQIFINNQKSALTFIEESIMRYKETFKKSTKRDIADSFQKVDKERKKQRDRIYLIQSLLWFVPVLAVCIILFFSMMKAFSLGLGLIYIVIAIGIFFIAPIKGSYF